MPMSVQTNTKHLRLNAPDRAIEKAGARVQRLRKAWLAAFKRYQRAMAAWYAQGGTEPEACGQTWQAQCEISQQLQAAEKTERMLLSDRSALWAVGLRIVK
jgi:hypothetical protein